MIRIIDTYNQLNSAFVDGHFDLDAWENYMNSVYPCSIHIFLDDLHETVANSDYTFEKDFLPILNAVYGNSLLEQLHDSFLQVADGLNERVISKFGKEIEIDVVLYLGLCNGAGWVTKVNDRDSILLGVEKILELNWNDLNSMYGLIYHELGHAYHAQHGKLSLCETPKKHRQKLLWQLFTEGVAMYFEQVCVGDYDYYHQDINGWKKWCEQHHKQALLDFNIDISSSNQLGQRFFGDWCDYNGHGDVGYYLGAVFVKYLLKERTFDEILNYDINAIEKYFDEYCRLILS